MAKHKLLLADDSVTIQKVVNLTFADEGIEVTAVGDGDQAMQKFVESMPDLVMVDVNMPGADGYRICEMIKGDEETRHIPVILLVGSFEPFDEAEARRVGADDYLTKPFQSIRQLVNKVSDLLSGKTSHAFGNDDAAVVSSFEDTLEMPPIKGTLPGRDFGDAALDDDLIQADQIGSLPVNEAQKFAAPASDLPASEDEEDLSFETQDFENLDETSAEESAPTPELAPEEQPDELVEDSADDDDEPLPRHENIYDFASEEEFDSEESATVENEAENSSTETAETTEAVESKSFEPELMPEDETAKAVVEEDRSLPVENVETTAMSATTREFELDDFDLLEVPRAKKSGDEKSKAFLNQSKVSDVQAAGNLSPADIEAIAEKVVEKLSDQTIKRIVREVFEQMTKKK